MAERVIIASRNFTRGQQDTRVPEGQEFPDLSAFHNMRGDGGTARRRLGARKLPTRLSPAEPSGLATDNPTHGLAVSWGDPVNLLGGNQHTIDFAFLETTGASGTRPIFGCSTSGGPLEIYLTGGDTLNVSYKTVSDGTKLLQHTYESPEWLACRIVRTPGTVKLIVNDSGYTASTPNLSAIDQPGTDSQFLFEDNAGNFGTDIVLSWFRVFDEAHDHNAFMRSHFPNPRHPSVRWYQTGQEGAHAIYGRVFYDHSSYQRHSTQAAASSGITELAGPDGTQHATAVQLLREQRMNDGTRNLVAVRAGCPFFTEIE